ncbi:MAG: fibrobacter succinogenes major paralogous domain-containing protein [Bacteroidetes bacterium]|nr:fibrobacter succinogenes major paralogous domain-containing protein [Bacteroidota bacterium]
MIKRDRIQVYAILLMGVFITLTVSCKKSNDSNPSNAIVDNDGNVYHSVTLGTQVWMLENLKTTTYLNGDSIPNVKGNVQWFSLTSGAQCCYQNDTANASKYGRLYNFYAVTDSRKIAPKGWHVATDAEWTTLKNYLSANLGTSGSFAKAIAATTDWASSTIVLSIGNDLSRNNSSGFTAVPGGFRWDYGAFGNLGSITYWWTGTESGSTSAYFRLLYSDSVDEHKASDLKGLGLSVRCVKD